jgi:hypothetical protein
MGGTLSSFKYRASFPGRYPTIHKTTSQMHKVQRLNKKLKKVNRDAAASEFRDAAAAGLPRLSKERSAGSGNFVPFLGSSNPRVLSDMGLAIPRPTRLGDPRSEPESNSVSVCASLSNIILTSLRCCPFLRAALQLFAAVLLLAAMVPTI